MVEKRTKPEEMTEHPIVRVATPADIERLYWLLVRDLEADNSLAVPVSPKRVFDHVARACHGQDGIAGVIEENGAIVASVGIFAAQGWFSEEWMLDQMWLFVHPSARAGNVYAEALFDFALRHRDDMEKKLGYKVLLQNTVMSFVRLGTKIRFWSRYGKLTGAVFWNRGERHGKQEPDHHAEESLEPGTAGRLRRPHI